MKSLYPVRISWQNPPNGPTGRRVRDYWHDWVEQHSIFNNPIAWQIKT
jgi:hypothetical protein